MKLEELMEVDQYQQQMRDAMSDMAEQELQKIHDNPMKYYMQFDSGRISMEQAVELQNILDKVDDKTFFLIANSPKIIASIEDNYDYSTDSGSSSYIDYDVLMDVLNRAKGRIG